MKYEFPNLTDSDPAHGYVVLHIRGGVLELATEPDTDTLEAIRHFGGRLVEAETKTAKKSTKKAQKASEVTNNDSTDA
jgi:hypothetical protein